MSFVILPRPTKIHFLFLAFFISTWVRYLIQKFVQPKNGKNIHLLEERYFDIIMNVSCDLLTGIFCSKRYLYNRKISQKKILLEELNKKRVPNRQLISKDGEEYEEKIFKIIIFRIALLDMICQNIFFIFTNIFYNNNIIPVEFCDIFLIIDIISRYIFSRIVLKTYFYRHQIVSIIINIIVLIPLGIIDILNIIKIQKTPIVIIIYTLFNTLQVILYSREDVLNKVALQKEGLTPCSLLFYKALYQVILFILPITIIFAFIACSNYKNNIFEFFIYYNKKNLLKRILFRILFGISNIARSVSLVSVIDKFSPQHLSVLKVFESLFIFILNISTIKEKTDYSINFIFLVCYFFLIITSFIYNEMIIFKVCRLEESTRYGMQIKAIQEESDFRDTIREISEFENSSEENSELNNNDSISSFNK